MKSIGTSATHNVCLAECQNSNDKVVLRSSFLRGRAQPACATSIVLSIRPDALEHLTPSRTLYSYLYSLLILCLYLNLCFHLYLCLSLNVCIWIALSICPLPSCSWTPQPLSSTVVCVLHFLNIFLLLALSLLWNPFCQALFCTYTALVKDFCKRQTSSLHWQARCHLCLQWAVFSLLLSSISLWKPPKNYRAHNCSFSKWSIKRQYKPVAINKAEDRSEDRKTFAINFVAKHEFHFKKYQASAVAT